MNVTNCKRLFLQTIALLTLSIGWWTMSRNSNVKNVASFIRVTDLTASLQVNNNSSTKEDITNQEDPMEQNEEDPIHTDVDDTQGEPSTVKEEHLHSRTNVKIADEQPLTVLQIVTAERFVDRDLAASSVSCPERCVCTHKPLKGTRANGYDAYIFRTVGPMQVARLKGKRFVKK